MGVEGVFCDRGGRGGGMLEELGYIFDDGTLTVR